MPKMTLSGGRVKALEPRPSACDLRDKMLEGFGVRALPSGAKRFCIHTQAPSSEMSDALPWLLISCRSDVRLSTSEIAAKTNAVTTPVEIVASG